MALLIRRIGSGVTPDFSRLICRRKLKPFGEREAPGLGQASLFSRRAVILRRAGLKLALYRLFNSFRAK
jgi:hypothetical protein